MFALPLSRFFSPERDQKLFRSRSWTAIGGNSHRCFSPSGLFIHVTFRYFCFKTLGRMNYPGGNSVIFCPRRRNRCRCAIFFQLRVSESESRKKWSGYKRRRDLDIGISVLIESSNRSTRLNFAFHPLVSNQPNPQTSTWFSSPRLEKAAKKGQKRYICLCQQ